MKKEIILFSLIILFLSCKGIGNVYENVSQYNKDLSSQVVFNDEQSFNNSYVQKKNKENRDRISIANE